MFSVSYDYSSNRKINFFKSIFSVSDSEPTKPLSVDGNSSELDMEELEEEEGGVGRGEAKGTTVVPKTPDQEAFLKQHFGNLAELNNPGKNSLHPSYLVLDWYKTCWWKLPLSHASTNPMLL